MSASTSTHLLPWQIPAPHATYRPGAKELSLSSSTSSHLERSRRRTTSSTILDQSSLRTTRPHNSSTTVKMARSS